MCTVEPSLQYERSHIDGEAVLHIGLHHSLPGFFDFLDGDGLDAGGNFVLTAEVEHLPGFIDAADGECQIAAS